MSITLLSVTGPSACDVARLALAFGPYFVALCPCLTDIDLICAACRRLRQAFAR